MRIVRCIVVETQLFVCFDESNNAIQQTDVERNFNYEEKCALREKLQVLDK